MRLKSFVSRSAPLSFVSVLGLTLGLQLVACSDDSSTEDPSSESPSGSGGSNTSTGGHGGDTSPDTDTEDCGTRKPTEIVEVNKMFSYNGYVMTVSNAELYPDTDSCYGRLELITKFENITSDNWSLNSDFLVTSNGVDYSQVDLVNARAEAKRSSNGTMRIQVDDKFELDTATLLFGKAGNHIAVVPLGKNSPDKFISLLNQSFEIDDFEAGPVSFKVTETRARANLTLGVDAKELYIDFLIDVTSTTSDSFNISRDNFTLQLPDGSIATPRNAPVEFLRATGETIFDTYLSFMIRYPAQGDYKLIVGDDFWGVDRTPVHVEVPFTLPDFEAFSGEK